MNRLLALSLAFTCAVALQGCGGGEPAANGGTVAPAAPASGLSVYQSRCAFCHGTKGDANTPMAAGYPYANLADGKWAYGGSRDELRKTIAQGIPGTPMRGFNGILTDAEIDAVIDHMKSF
jgi:mono/diheme cytochrome c family protein